MKTPSELSLVTQRYLKEYRNILEEMICQMTQAELTGSISHNFIVQMIPHHRAAIRMSENLLQYTTCIPLQEIALRIITEQTKSIQDMENALKSCCRFQNPQQQLCRYQLRFGQITQAMFSEMKTACATNNLNSDFMREMIPHHQGAVRMSENALCFAICPELKPILRAIITSQEAGIREMQQLLCSSTCQ
ncbi:hypothetical protein BRYFOR_08708 [Marvinbryantia formatexigens DSM 14469]|uniref:DUF305 domain-containing protein n=1 Tax=Marvinbryantia formatexigens DSM 14469 TaxID=478749 RepID=C6LJ73_9FIRM|nr:DUF305 domain-containing protein [Marvinbryantia formatexigens]EET59393.1 hypothetical protein BRYFOR_08708 [Marvinbryantia formatexigens DSM 14469]UWO24348.1 DUF305 domain-containing protein [Marvinbryantia formatexigens DSM 14469]SDF52885.1 Uncharacterized conserved protein, DUF305 family [Marvinbryantia formatexigens]